VTCERFCIESGTYSFMAGSSSAILPLHVVLELEGEGSEVIPLRDLSQPTKAINYDDYEGVQIGECMDYECTISIACMEDSEALNVRSAVEVQEQAGWIAFKDVDFGDGVRQFKLRAASAQEQAIAVEIRLQTVNGILVGKLEFTGTGVQQWQDYVVDLEDILDTNGEFGRQDVYIIINGRAAVSMIQFLA
jgi:beta-glucosidase